MNDQQKISQSVINVTPCVKWVQIEPIRWHHLTQDGLVLALVGPNEYTASRIKLLYTQSRIQPFPQLLSLFLPQQRVNCIHNFIFIFRQRVRIDVHRRRDLGVAQTPCDRDQRDFVPQQMRGMSVPKIVRTHVLDPDFPQRAFQQA